MKGKFTKFRKLLCYVIISLFMFGIGGELVKAKVFYSRDTLKYRYFPVPPYYTSFQWFYPADNPSEDAWCLNSTRNPSSGYDLPYSNVSLIPATKKNSIINIINASKNLNLSAGEKYYVTQAAIWYTLNGTGTDGITTGFLSWLQTNYGNSWKILMDSRGNAVANPSISVSDHGYTMEVDGEYLVSNDFHVNSNGVSGNFNVDINSGSSNGACVLYNNQCTSHAEVPAGASFKIRVDKPSDAAGTVDATFNVTPRENVYVYDIDTYMGVNSYGVQNMAILTSKEKNLRISQSVKGNYTNNTDVEIQKTDKDTNAKVAGAKLYIEDENGNRIGEYESTATGVDNPRVSLPTGKYFLGETSQPNGYYYNSDKVEFNVVNDNGTMKVLDSDGNEFSGSVPTISFANSKIKIKFRKVDIDGNPLEGIKFEIVDYPGIQTDVENSRLCAYTDSNGYLTIPCSGDENTGNVNSSGEYTLGLDFGRDGSIYRINEFCENDSCKQYMRKNGMSASFPGITDFQVMGSSVILASPNLSLSYEGDANTPVIVMNMVNRHFINISKTDITKSKEIPGAHLYVTDLSITPSTDSSNVSIDNLVDEWVSTKYPHEILGIVPGNKYRLTEEVSPAGYVGMINSIDFIMDADGNVKVYDIVSGDEITDLNGTDYELLITNAPIKTVFSKTDAVTGEEIPGAKLKVCTAESYNNALATTGDGNNCEAFASEYTNNGDPVEWTSVEGESKIIDALPAGDYYLIETIAPTGYTKTTAVDFTVKSDGSVTQVVMTDEPTRLTISKKNQVTGERVPNAKFEIIDLETNEIAKDYKGTELSWTSDGQVDWEILGIPTGRYKLIETLVPEGYQEGMIIDGELVNEYEFTIGDKEGDVNIDVFIEVLNAPNTGISTLNLFAIGGLMVFAGYETIKIYRRKALNN